MSIGQKSKDALAMLRQSKKWQIIAAVAVFVVFFTMFGNNSTKPRRQKPQQEVSVGTVNTREHSNDVVVAFRETLDQSKAAIERIGERITVTDKKIEDNERRTAEILKTMLERMDRQQGSSGSDNHGAADYAPIPLPGVTDNAPTGSLLPVGMNQSDL